MALTFRFPTVRKPPHLTYKLNTVYNNTSLKYAKSEGGEAAHPLFLHRPLKLLTTTTINFNKPQNNYLQDLYTTLGIRRILFF